jgi:hypothetical protein
MRFLKYSLSSDLQTDAAYLKNDHQILSNRSITLCSVHSETVKLCEWEENLLFREDCRGVRFNALLSEE